MKYKIISYDSYYKVKKSRFGLFWSEVFIVNDKFKIQDVFYTISECENAIDKDVDYLNNKKYEVASKPKVLSIIERKI